MNFVPQKQQKKMNKRRKEGGLGIRKDNEQSNKASNL